MQNTKTSMLASQIKPITTCFLSVVMAIALLNITGCSVTSRVWPPYDKISISADKNVNLDVDSRPSPVQVKIYELSSRTTFDNLDFDGLFNHPEAQLSDELLSKIVFFLQPNETLKHKIQMQKEASYIAVLAAYRDIDNVRWKHVYKVKSHGRYRHSITLSEDGIIAGKVVEETQSESKKDSREKKDTKDTDDTDDKKTNAQDKSSGPKLIDKIKNKTSDKLSDKILEKVL